MCGTCDFGDAVSKMIQLRHVPDGVHKTLKSRAGKKRMSLSDYLVREVTEIAKTPSLEEMAERLATREPVEFLEPVHETIRKMRRRRLSWMRRQCWSGLAGRPEAYASKFDCSWS
jgi:antitoxin FitA